MAEVLDGLRRLWLWLQTCHWAEISLKVLWVLGRCPTSATYYINLSNTSQGVPFGGLWIHTKEPWNPLWEVLDQHYGGRFRWFSFLRGWCKHFGVWFCGKLGSMSAINPKQFDCSCSLIGRRIYQDLGLVPMNLLFKGFNPNTSTLPRDSRTPSLCRFGEKEEWRGGKSLAVFMIQCPSFKRSPSGWDFNLDGFRMDHGVMLAGRQEGNVCECMCGEDPSNSGVC